MKLKSKIGISFLVIAFIIFTLSIVFNYGAVKATDISTQNISITGKREYSKAFEVLKMVNEEREAANKASGKVAGEEGYLVPLKMDASLLEAAMVRAAETAVCFSHTRPDGTSCFTINDKMMGENIALGQTSAYQVMTSWMNSQGHKDNILKNYWSSIGIGCFYQEGVYFWTQCFGMEDIKENCSKPKDGNKTQTLAIATEKFKGLAILGDNNEYSYNFSVVLDKSEIEAGKTCSAKLYVINAGYPYVATPIDNNNIKWSSESTKKAKVDSKGKVTGVGKGSTSIIAKIGNYKASSKIVINKGTQKLSYKKEFEKSYGDKSFKINAKLERGDGKLSYSSSDKKVATVDSKGKVTIKGTGICTITVKAKGTSNYKEKKVKITLKVKPKKASLKSVKASKGKKMTVKWSKDTRASGYQIYYSTSKNFSSKNTKKITVSGNKNVSKTIKSLKKGKKYYVKVRSYKTAKINGKNQKLYGSWSKVKNITAKK